jgi:hypothetical protein
MIRDELLVRQRELIAYLATPAAFERLDVSRHDLPSVSGFDLNRLELVGRLAQGKRMSKLLRILPRTFRYLNGDVGGIAREFAILHPPRSAEAFATACQFYMFLRRTWRTTAPKPSFLPDLAYCELALAGVARRLPIRQSTILCKVPSFRGRALLIRRQRGIHYRRCEHNIQPLFTVRLEAAARIVRRPTFVLLTCPLASGTARLATVDQDVFDIVVGLRNWTRCSLEDGVGDPRAVIDLFRGLEELGVIEVQLCESA